MKKDDVIAFTQNARDEVRILGTDGNVSGSISASSGTHQSTYIVIRKKKGEK